MILYDLDMLISLSVQERGILFRRYLTLHVFVTLGAFVVAGVMIGLSAGHHDDAQKKCISRFFTAQSTSTSLADTLCDIFPWVDVGVMGGLWLLLAVSQVCPPSPLQHIVSES